MHMYALRARDLEGMEKRRKGRVKSQKDGNERTSGDF